MQRFAHLRKAGQGFIEFTLILGSVSLAAFVFMTTLAPRLLAAIH